MTGNCKLGVIRRKRFSQARAWRKRCLARCFLSKRHEQSLSRIVFDPVLVGEWKFAKGNFVSQRSYRLGAFHLKVSSGRCSKATQRRRFSKPESINALHYVADSSLVMIFEVINLIKRYWKCINDSATNLNQVLRIHAKSMRACEFYLEKPVLTSLSYFIYFLQIFGGLLQNREVVVFVG